MEEGRGHGGGEGSRRRGGVTEEGRGHGGGEGSRRRGGVTEADYPFTLRYVSPILTYHYMR